MVVSQSPRGNIESVPAAPPDDPPKIHSLASIGRQSSIYSLTLDEFQHTLCETGKNFGSMNMDEFLTNIWTAEENNQAATATGVLVEEDEAAEQNNDQTKSTPPGLSRQGSLTIPAPLCRKTVEEVWSEIHRNQQQQQPQNSNNNNVGSSGSTHHRTQTFGEMTLEDFLIKAGVVREQQNPLQSQPPPGPPQQYGIYNSTADQTFGSVSLPGAGPGPGPGPIMGLGNGGMSGYQTYPHAGGVMGETSSYAGNGGKRNGSGGGGYSTGGVCFSSGGRVSNGFGSNQTLGIGSPVSPVSSDGMGGNPVDNSPYGFDMGGAGASGMRGRKRVIDGPVEKVVERRQRRMIKNRESAARSRARKQAYTVELEAELNQLKEENARLKQTLIDANRKRRHELQEEFKERPPTKAQKAKDKLRSLRRTLSTPP
ncbi:hypothetical protein GIB67_029523 [Kingdonia uniflora]|uniref:BZIP domain-containing protein n=1 Tax=Kingdonia uniflora TaxID=39325 RepID=A0A7J7NY44_9MAGN|nr:hypothetical protein GIB67_029523 [Kingdonia uniflora]